MNEKRVNRKIRIGFPLSLSGGGPSLFMRRLRESIKKQEIAVVSSFINPFTDINIFSNITRDLYGKPYIFRVDGIYFDKGQPDETNEIRNKPIFDGIDRAAGIIFQSSFGLNLVSEFHKKIDKPFEIVNNGVDTSFFSTAGANKREELGINESDIVFVTSAKWRVHKRLGDVINVFKEYDKNSHRKCYLLILGKDSNVPDPGHPRIRNIGFIEPTELPVWYRTGNIFLFFSWLDNCPNSVIEAISCGLPVVCTNQGGTRELVELTKGGVVADADEAFKFEPVELYRPPKPDYQKTLSAIGLILTNYDKYVQAIDRTMISIDNVAKRYIAFIEKVFLGSNNRKN